MVLLQRSPDQMTLPACFLSRLAFSGIKSGTPAGLSAKPFTKTGLSADLLSFQPFVCLSLALQQSLPLPGQQPSQQLQQLPFFPSLSCTCPSPATCVLQIPTLSQWLLSSASPLMSCLLWQSGLHAFSSVMWFLAMSTLLGASVGMSGPAMATAVERATAPFQ